MPAVVAVLRGRGVRDHDCDDVVQEVGVRAYTAWLDGAITSSFRGWCVGTARHVSADLWRQRRTEPLGDEALAIADSVSTEREVDGRLELVGVRRAWAELSPAERRMLRSAAPSDEATPAEANRFYVALHRLRRRTQRMAERLAPGILGWLNRARDRIGQPAIEAASAAFVIGVTVATMGGGIIVTGRPAPHRATDASPAVDGPPLALRWVAATANQPASAATARQRPPQTTLRSPVEAGARVPTPVADNVRGRIYNAEPEQAPLLCVTAPPLTGKRCVEHPIRP